MIRFGFDGKEINNSFSDLVTTTSRLWVDILRMIAGRVVDEKASFYRQPDHGWAWVSTKPGDTNWVEK